MALYMLPRVLIGITVLFLAESSCPNGWLTHREMCYHFSHDTEDWLGAKAMCKLFGGQLVEIENATEGAYLSNQVKLSNANFWIGLDDVLEEGTWTWVNSMRLLSSTQYHSWAHGQPDNTHKDQNCAFIETKSGHWYDGACHVARRFICERGGIDAEIVG